MREPRLLRPRQRLPRRGKRPSTTDSPPEFHDTNGLLVQDWHEQQGVVNTAETERKEKRLEQQEKALTENGRSLPLIYKTLRRFTQAMFKLIR